MKNTTHPTFGSLVRGTGAAALITVASLSAALADEQRHGLENFLAHPANFVAISEGLTGPVTSATMADNTLAVQFVIPTHAGETVGEYVGTVDVNGLFVGEGILTPEHGEARTVEVIMSFENDGTVVAAVDGDIEDSGFLPTTMHFGF